MHEMHFRDELKVSAIRHQRAALNVIILSPHCIFTARPSSSGREQTRIRTTVYTYTAHRISGSFTPNTKESRYNVFKPIKIKKSKLYGVYSSVKNNMKTQLL